MKKLIVTVNIVLIFFVSICELSAGWIIYEKSHQSDLKSFSNFKYYIQDQKLKLEEEGLTTIFNLQKQTITFIVPHRSLYWTGFFIDYKKEFKESLQKSFQKRLEQIPDTQKEMAQATFDYYIESIEDTLRSEQDFLDMAIINTGKKDKIAGFNASMYGLFVNKNLKEEIWISEEIQINNEFDMVRFNDLLKQMGNSMVGELNYQASNSFARLLQKGLLMKTVEYGYDINYTTEVYKVKQKVLDESVFQIPSGFEKTDLAGLGLFDETE